MENNREWEAYLELMRERPELFRQDPRLPIVLDEAEVNAFTARTGRKLGVVYRSPYHLMVVDLVRGPDGNCFAYERLLPAVAKGAVVTVPVWGTRYALLRQFRHALRGEELSFPRGFGEEGLSAEENAAKELKEELGASVLSVEPLGSLSADSGSQGGGVQVVLCRIDHAELKKDYEGIQEVLFPEEKELREWIVSGKITDGFTLSAWALLQARRSQ